MKFKAIVFVLQDVPVINIFKQTDIIRQFSPPIKLKNKIHVKSIFAVNICQNFMHLFLKAFQQTDSHGSAVQMSPESLGLFFHISNVYRPLILSWIRPSAFYSVPGGAKPKWHEFNIPADVFCDIQLHKPDQVFKSFSFKWIWYKRIM